MSVQLNKDDILATFQSIPNTTGIALEARADPTWGEISSLKDAFVAGADNTTATIAMCKRVINYSKSIANRTENITYFGGNLLGTDRIRFYSTDRDRWFDEVLQIDEAYLQECIHAVPAVDKDWKVAGDAFNLSVIWFVHRAINDIGLRDKTAYEAMVEALIMLQFRLITSAYTNFFAQPVDEAAAEATYAASSMKFRIRQLGSWGAVLRWRAESYLSKDSTHARTLQKFEDDAAVMYVVTDISTRIRKMIKDQYAILDRIRSGNLRIQTTSNSIEIDGEKIIRDTVNAYSTAKYYLLDVAGNESSFIKLELVDVVLDVMSTASKQALLDVLVSVARTPTGKKRDVVESILDDTLLYCFEYIAKHRIRFTDVGYILSKMRAMITSSKSDDPRLHSLRERLEKYARQHTHLRASSALASVRTAVMLYVLLRALSANVYSK
jgi:predicted nucleic acid-binding Zn ribbon protein